MSMTSKADQEPSQVPWHKKALQINYLVGLGIRYWLATGFLSYGLAKLLGIQFFHAGPALDQPTRTLSGFQLTWIFFGYAPMYSKLIGFGQVISAILLVFDRTRRLGAMILLPIICNIVMVNYFYTINSYVMTLSTLYLLGTLYVLLPDTKAIWCFFLVESETTDKPLFLQSRGGLLAGLGALFLVAAGCYHVRHYVKHEQKARPLLYGDYKVVKLPKNVALTKPSAPILLWDTVYLRHFGLFQAKKGKVGHIGRYRLHTNDRSFALRYHIAGKKKSAYIWFKGSYTRTKGLFLLEGMLHNKPMHLVLEPMIWPKNQKHQVK